MSATSAQAPQKARAGQCPGEKWGAGQQGPAGSGPAGTPWGRRAGEAAEPTPLGLNASPQGAGSWRGQGAARWPRGRTRACASRPQAVPLQTAGRGLRRPVRGPEGGPRPDGAEPAAQRAQRGRPACAVRGPGLARVPAADTQVRPGPGGQGERREPAAVPKVSWIPRVQQPGLQEALQYLVSTLRQGPALSTLDLSGCQLSGPMVTYLCAVLQHPECRLQTLRWMRAREGGRNTTSQPRAGVGTWTLHPAPEMSPPLETHLQSPGPGP